MIKRVILTILIGLSIPTLSYSQTDSIPENQTRFSAFLNHEKLAFKLSYFGELLLHPGLEIGSDFTLVHKKWVDIHWDINLSGYYHKWNNSSYSLSSSIGTRFPIYALFFDLNIGVGYMHSFPAGTIYKKSANGIEEATNYGTSHFRPSLSTLIGWNGSKYNSYPIKIFLGPELYFQSHFNHSYLPHIAAKFGVIYKFSKRKL